MIGPYSAFVQPYEGAFVNPPRDQSLAPAWANPYPSTLGFPGALVSNVPGTIQGRFGWASAATGQVNNTRLAASDQIGIVIPRRLTGWSWQFFDPAVNAWRVRPGLNLTMVRLGNFWLRFAGGAYPGDVVYASLVDGSAISGESSNAEATVFKVVSTGEPGCLAKVSSYAFFGD